MLEIAEFIQYATPTLVGVVHIRAISVEHNQTSVQPEQDCASHTWHEGAQFLSHLTTHTGVHQYPPLCLFTPLSSLLSPRSQQLSHQGGLTVV